MTQAYMRLPRILRQIKMYSAAPCTSTPRRSRSRVVGGLCTSSALLNMSPLLLLVLEEHLAHVRLVTYKFFRRSAPSLPVRRLPILRIHLPPITNLRLERSCLEELFPTSLSYHHLLTDFAPCTPQSFFLPPCQPSLSPSHTDKAWST